jgi:two-component system CheB/CheR fusion protein
MEIGDFSFGQFSLSPLKEMSDYPQTNDASTVSRHILVIEDNHDSAEVLQTFLEINGHRVSVRHSAPEGLNAVSELTPDIVICDISLSSETDGYDIANQIKQNDELRSIFLIALSGYGRPEDKEKSKAAGFDEHLTKPTNFDKLIHLINSYDRS